MTVFGAVAVPDLLMSLFKVLQTLNPTSTPEITEHFDGLFRPMMEKPGVIRQPVERGKKLNGHRHLMLREGHDSSDANNAFQA